MDLMMRLMKTTKTIVSYPLLYSMNPHLPKIKKKTEVLVKLWIFPKRFHIIDITNHEEDSRYHNPNFFISFLLCYICTCTVLYNKKIYISQ
jgi:hypothetical protein